MTRNVRDIVRDLLNDTTVREKVPYVPIPPAPTVIVRKETVAPVRTITPPPPSVTSGVLDPSCQHKWAWKSGGQYCWLCDGPKPPDAEQEGLDVRDRRDSSTTWQSTVRKK